MNILGIFISFQVTFACENLLDCEFCQQQNCFWIQREFDGPHLCADNLNTFFAATSKCDEQQDTHTSLNTSKLLTERFDSHNEYKKVEHVNKEENFPKREKDLIKPKKPFGIEIPNSTLIPPRFFRRYQRNQCHYINHLRRLQKIFNATLYEEIIEGNIMFGKEKICDELIKERKMERLERFPSTSALIADEDCATRFSCDDCVKNCFWLTNESNSWCSAVEPIQSNITFVPPGGSLWCKTPEVRTQSDTYKIAFWCLLIIVIITLVGVGIFLRKKKPLPDEQIPLSTL